jgi:HEAT repeat protein
MKILKGPVVITTAQAILLVALFLLYPSATYSTGYDEPGRIRSLPPGSNDEMTEGVKPFESIEDLKAYESNGELNPREIVARLNAALALGKIKGPEAVEALSALLRNSSLGVVQFVAATALGEIGDPEAVVPLTDALQDKEREGAVRVAAATALAKIGDPRAVLSLMDSLSDEDPDVRAGTANALGVFGDTRAVLPLIASLGDENPFVRYNSARALGQLKHPLAVNPLISSLREERVSEVRWWAVHALGEIKDARAVEPLSHAVEVTDRRTMAPYTDVIEVGDSLRAKEGSMAELIKDMHWSIQLEAIRSLGKIGEAALPALVATLSEHQDLDFRKEAAQNIIDIKCAQFMISLLEEENSLEIVKEVYPQVISSGESGTVDVLIQALKAHGERHMAGDFLASRNKKLERAGRTWMKQKGYKPVPPGPEKSPQWGEHSKEDCEAFPRMDEDSF